MRRVWFLPVIAGGAILTLAACSSQRTEQNEATAAPTSPSEQVDQEVALGQEAFARVCAQCHGANAEGRANELNAPALNSTEHASEHPDQQIHDWIVNGKLGLGREMPALGNLFSDDEVHGVIAYLHTLWTDEQLAIQQNITSRWPATPEPGRDF